MTSDTANITAEEGKMVADKIRHLLTYFPKLSHSMLQVGLGSTVPASLWRPILEEMVAEGEVCIVTVMATMPSGRSATFSVIQFNLD